MGDLAVVAEYESALDSSKKSRKLCSMELNKSLTLMGFGTWNNLEPGKQLVKSKTNIAFNVRSAYSKYCFEVA